MSLDTTVRARIDSELKKDVEEILSEIGLTTSQAITLFMKGIKRERGIPFELKIPNKKTIEAMNEAKNNIGLTVSLEEFLEESR